MLKCFLLADFVLVYEEDTEAVARKSQQQQRGDGGSPSGSVGSPGRRKEQQQRHEAWRNKFLNNLMKAGLEMEEVRERRR